MALLSTFPCTCRACAVFYSFFDLNLSRGTLAAPYLLGFLFVTCFGIFDYDFCYVILVSFFDDVVLLTLYELFGFCMP